VRRPLIPTPWSYALIILAFASFAVYGLAKWLLSAACVFCGSDLDIAAIEGNTDVDLPPSATDIRSYAEGFQDITTYVRFTIPAADLAIFLASTGCQDPPITTDLASRSPRAGMPDWWHPEEVASLLACSGLEDRTHQTIYVDASEPMTVKVFLVAAVY
jgi:hypothetical protein